MSEKKRIWDLVYHTNPLHTEAVTDRSGNVLSYSIDAYRQIEKATEIFGAYGESWGVRDEKFNLQKMEIPDKGLYTYVCLYTGTLFYPGGIIPIHSDIECILSTQHYTKYSTGWSKKVATNALSKGLSKLGFNADVFQDRFSDKDYVQEMNVKFGNIIDTRKPIDSDMIKDINYLIAKSGVLSLEKVIDGLNRVFKTEFTDIKDLKAYHYMWIKNAIETKYIKKK